MSQVTSLDFTLPLSVKLGDSSNITLPDYTAKLIEHPVTHGDDLIGYITGTNGIYSMMYNLNAERLAGQSVHIVLPEED